MVEVDLIQADMNVEDLILKIPGTARVFIRWRMNCVGCDIARFHTIAEACDIYNVPLDAVLADLSGEAGRMVRAIRRQPSRSLRQSKDDIGDDEYKQE